MGDLDEKDLLTRELRERSADVGGHPIGLDAVRQSARRIRRRRNIISGAVAAVVASVALPTGVAITSAVNGPDRPAPSPHIATTPTPDATPTPAPKPRPDGSYPLTLHGIPRGEDPKLDYVVARDRTLVTPEGEVELPEAYTQIVPFRDGWLALHGGKNGYENLVLDSGMNVLDRTLGGEAVALSADGTRVLTVQRDFNVPGRTVVVDQPAESDYEREAVTYDVPKERMIAPVGYLDDKRVVFQAVDGEKTYIAMGIDDGDPHVRELEGFNHVTAVSEAAGLVVGQVSYDDRTGGSCYGAMDPSAEPARMVWQTCDYEPHAFSPDGRFVLAGAAGDDGLGSPTLAVLDAQSGEPVVEFTPERDVFVAVSAAAWEDEDTVVAAVIEGNRMAMVRADLSGRLEVASQTFPSGMDVPIWFAETPRW